MATTKESIKKNQPEKTEFLYKRENYLILLAGVVVITIGYFLMAGGTQKPTEFNYNEIYSFRRITLAPIVVVLGYVIVGFGILRKPKS